MSNSNSVSVKQMDPSHTAMKVQAAILGIILILAYLIKIPLLILIVEAFVILGFIFFNLKLPIFRLNRNTGAHFFVSAVVAFVLALAFLLLHFNYTIPGWILTMFVAALLVMAGVSGFCLVTFIYLKIFQNPPK